MAIETASRNEQTKLIEESREERLTRLFDLEMKIQKMRDKKDQLKSQHNAVNNEIKANEKDKVELLNLINSGQGTFIPVATSTVEESEVLDGDIPSDEELEEFADSEASEEAEDSEGEDSDIPADDEESDELSEIVEAVDAFSDSAFEAEAENSDETTQEIIPADVLFAAPDHRVLINAETMERLGTDKSKTRPSVGAVHSLPVKLRSNGKTHYFVKAVSLLEGEMESCWETFVELWSHDDWEAYKATNPSGIPF